eukprot:10128018-Ditylum_brightwellii.AAC.1
MDEKPDFTCNEVSPRQSIKQSTSNKKILEREKTLEKKHDNDNNDADNVNTDDDNVDDNNNNTDDDNVADNNNNTDDDDVDDNNNNTGNDDVDNNNNTKNNTDNTDD